MVILTIGKGLGKMDSGKKRFSYICDRHKTQDKKYEIHQLFNEKGGEILWRKILPQAVYLKILFIFHCHTFYLTFYRPFMEWRTCSS